MRILTLSDSHSRHNQIPLEWLVPADVIIHAGDISNMGYLNEIESFFEWYDKLKYSYKIFCVGNHDWAFETKPKQVAEILKDYPNIIYLQDESIIIDGVKIHCSPQSPYFFNWAFNCARNKQDSITYKKPLITDYWDKIDDDVNILCVHSPVYGINDFVPYRGGEHVGCRDLLDVVYNRLNKLSLLIHGHIHYSYGTTYRNGVLYVNASIVNEQYNVVNKPILIEYNKELNSVSIIE